MALFCGNLIREDAIHSSVYTDPEIFRLEMEVIFGRSWILLGHRSQLPSNGDYITSRIGSAAILIIRGTDGQIRAFLNHCPHRGTRLCSSPCGHAERVVCPYHGWVFSTVGELKAVPIQDEYPASFKFRDHNLRAIARLETYRGFIFGCLATEAPSLEQFLGRMRTSIDDLVDRAPDDKVEVTAAIVRHRYRGNWKLSFENLNDVLHAGVTHATSVRAARKISAQVGDPTKYPDLLMMTANGKPIRYFQELESVTEGYGHSFIGGHIDSAGPVKIEDPYGAALAAARGQARAEEILSIDRHLTLLYPSSTWNGRFQTVRIIHPLAVDLTEVIGLVFRLKGAPNETFEPARQYCTLATSALSNVVTDDLEIYEGIQRESVRSPAWLPISRGLDPGNNSNVGRQPATSEAFIRNQYAHWLTMLSAS